MSDTMVSETKALSTSEELSREPNAGSLSRRFIFFTALWASLFAIAASLLAFRAEYGYEQARSDRILESFALAVHATASEAIEVNNEALAKEVVANLITSPFILEVDIRSSSSQKHALNVQGRLRAPTPLDQVKTWELHSPTNKEAIIGTLTLRKDAEEVHQLALAAAWRYTLSFVVLISLMVTFILWLFRHMMGKPLTQIEKEIGRITPGSTERISIPAGHENTELGALVGRTNRFLCATEQAFSEERRLRNEVNEIERHFQRVFASTNIGVMILGKEGHLISCNPVLSRILALTHQAIIDAKQADFLKELFFDPQDAWSMIKEAALSHQTVVEDLRIDTHSEKEVWMHCMFSVTLDEYEDISFIECVLYDVTERRAMEFEARKAAEIDELTQLCNRRGMEFFLSRTLRASHAKGFHIGVLLLDLDGFKAVNDTYGHSAGDMVLQEIAHRMGHRIRRSSDLVARMGGDEFVVIVADFGTSTALLENMAKDFVEMIARPILIAPGVWAKVGASIGISYSPDNGRYAKELLDAADASMYKVKKRGKNGYAFAEVSKSTFTSST